MRALAIGIMAIVPALMLANSHVDYNAAGQYGVSVGTSTTYCSADFPAGISCQNGS